MIAVPKTRQREEIRRRPDASWRSFVQETGLRNSAYGADKFGFKDLSAVHWNLTAPALYEHAIQAREATIVEGGALCAETGVHTGRSPKDKHTVVDALTENTVWWDGNRKLSQAQFPAALRGFHRACARQEAVRAGPLWRRRSEIPDKNAGLHRAGLAFAVHPPIADPSRALRARRFRPRPHHRRSARRSRPIPSATACAPRPSSPSTSRARSS